MTAISKAIEDNTRQSIRKLSNFRLLRDTDAGIDPVSFEQEVENYAELRLTSVVCLPWLIKAGYTLTLAPVNNDA